MEESLLEVTPSPASLEVYEISDISYPHMADPKEYIRNSVFEEKSPPILCKNSPVIL